MPTLTPAQLQDLATYRSTGELGDSLKDLFIDDCLNELNSNFTARYDFDIVCGIRTEINQKTGQIGFYFSARSFESLETYNQIHIVQTLLSRTPEGQAVMPFLDVESKDYTYLQESKEESFRDFSSQGTASFFRSSQMLVSIPKTLDHLLHREFTEALRLGKGFDLALETITKIYINHFYA